MASPPSTSGSPWIGELDASPAFLILSCLSQLHTFGPWRGSQDMPAGCPFRGHNWAHPSCHPPSGPLSLTCSYTTPSSPAPGQEALGHVDPQPACTTEPKKQNNLERPTPLTSSQRTPVKTPRWRQWPAGLMVHPALVCNYVFPNLFCRPRVPRHSHPPACTRFTVCRPGEHTFAGNSWRLRRAEAWCLHGVEDKPTAKSQVVLC